MIRRRCDHRSKKQFDRCVEVSGSRKSIKGELNPNSIPRLKQNGSALPQSTILFIIESRDTHLSVKSLLRALGLQQAS